MSTSNDFTYIILDINQRYIRVGLAGTSVPVVTIPNDGYPKTQKCPFYIDINDYTFNEEEMAKLLSQTKNPIKTVIEKYKDDSSEWMNQLHEVSLHNNLLKAFSLLSCGLSSCRIVVLDYGFSQLDKYVISKILLMKINAKSAQFIPTSILSTVSCNCGAGLVVEVNWGTVRISSIVDYRILYVVEDRSGLTGSNVHYGILEALVSMGHEIVDDVSGFGVIDSFISQLNYIESDLNIEKDLNIGKYMVSNQIGIQVIKTMVEQLVVQIRKVVEASNIDNKSLLCDNITFTGDITDIPGLKSGILTRLRDGQKQPMRANKCLGPWQGGSIYFSTSVGRRSRSVRKAQEITKEVLKDISNDKQVELGKLPEESGYKYI